MATRKSTSPYNKIENIITEKVFALEDENAELKEKLAIANAKLEVYERIVSISDSKTTLGFDPIMR